MNDGRVPSIDRLRVVLTVWVIAHHAAITYGGTGDWFYREVHDATTPTSLALTVFCAVNQAFFMGLFFLLAGRFTPSAVDRKGVPAFLWDRTVRLGVPVVVFGLVLGPLTVGLSALASPGGHAGEVFASAFGRFVIGPLWFPWALWWMALAYVVWRRLCAGTEMGAIAERPVPPSAVWLAAALAVGLAALLLRQWVPVGQTWLGVQIGYVASYGFLFALGCVAARHRWLERLRADQARRWGWVALLAAPVLFGVAWATEAVTGQPAEFRTGWSAVAVVYAFWEPFVAWGIIAVLWVAFRDRDHAPSARWDRWASHAYGAFVVHAPVLVAISVALAGWTAPPAVKFGLVTVAATVASFTLAGGLRRLSWVRRVL